MDSHENWSKQAARLRELSRNTGTRAYLLGRLLSDLDAAELEELVQACLLYRERFGAHGAVPNLAFKAGMNGYE